ncbi:glycosyltransferase family 1 protein [Halobacillus sp. BBL2006]|uniref:glycosyltransferase family 4 protein n=1 Tax=Halobacillus sp. BBL2006 TaxID=1543706 RepID=UPI000543C3CB|nr:glycosyltransferase family 1 protein [Halobacillus sp. BBL2006]KHE67413.1 mannosyltransferase [Halobacillus sp. BBL2006]
MQIFINGRFLSQETTGVQRYATEVVKAIDNLIDSGYIHHKDYRFVLLSPKAKKQNLSLKHIEIRTIGMLKGHTWEQLELPFHTKNNLLINLCNTSPIFKRRQLTVIHDAAVFANKQNFSFSFRLWYQFLYKLQARVASKIITVSNFSKNELVKYLKIDDRRIKVIYEGNEHFSNLLSGSAEFQNEIQDYEPYILAVSSLNPNKNFKVIVKALEYIHDKEINVVIAGGTNPKVFSTNGVELSNKVKHLGYVSDNQLKSLYKNAFCFIYPSLYEGFGLPPLEAMTVGCPVIVSDRASLPEVGGDSVIYCDPTNPEDIANKIKNLMDSPELHNKLINKGFKQSEKFTWYNTAKELFSVIQEME